MKQAPESRLSDMLTCPTFTLAIFGVPFHRNRQETFVEDMERLYDVLERGPLMRPRSMSTKTKPCAQVQIAQQDCWS